MPISIRPATIADEDAISRICLLTADAGASAVDMHVFPKLPGQIYAVSYLHFESGWVFALVDTDESEHDGAQEKVVGYILGAKDAPAYEQETEEKWWPALRELYGRYLQDPTGVKAADLEYIQRIFDPLTATDATLAFGRAYMHVNILPEYHGQGYGRKLIDTAVQYLGTLGHKSLWLRMNPKNPKGAAFYRKVGFRPLPEGTAPQAIIGLKFEDWGKKLE
ncbi:acyl-CoA N-acyltransferase [Hygrophoropsis aurantiaca]|uniref:Acyl-CoA N-acyltransferase n=1 Tax=Hygrophoropsis aurantiaca TaxID=72124 RepID=A0ACB8ASU3_9AGAM|nr:acyl-CoA N-acyltransferase [Hygrophoropsis aurantiaca]